MLPDFSGYGHRSNYAVTEERYDIMPIEVLMSYESVDSDEQHYDPISQDWVDMGPVLPVLAGKREDEHFPALVEELRLNGFTKGIRIHEKYRRVTDGHHRLAAALELGLKFVPVESKNWSADDSGCWYGDDYDDEDDYTEDEDD